MRRRMMLAAAMTACAAAAYAGQAQGAGGGLDGLTHVAGLPADMQGPAMDKLKLSVDRGAVDASGASARTPGKDVTLAKSAKAHASPHKYLEDMSLNGDALTFHCDGFFMCLGASVASPIISPASKANEAANGLDCAGDVLGAGAVGVLVGLLLAPVSAVLCLFKGLHLLFTGHP